MLTRNPVSHCIWEGRKMVEAARKYKRVVQAYDPLREQFTGPNATQANAHLKYTYRTPFVIGDTV